MVDLTTAQKKLIVAGREARKLYPAIAAEVGVSVDKVRRHLQAVGKAGRISESERKPAVDTSDPIKLRKANDENERLRGALRAAERRTHAAEDVRANLLGITSDPLRPIFVRPAKPSSAKNRQAVILDVSDVHFGEVVEKREVSGANSYSPVIAERRIARLFDTAALLTTKAWPRGDEKPSKIVVCLSGDMISGSIHEELSETNVGTAYEQMRQCAMILAGGIEHLHKKVGLDVPIEIISVDGNHGRDTMKPRQKKAHLHSWDRLVADFVEAALSRYENVRVYQADGFDAYFDVVGFPFLVTHGDRMGSGGGTGFIGPMASITKGHRKIVDTELRQRRPVYKVLTHHFHTTGATPFGFANGSVVGYGEYAKSFRGDPEPAQQNYLVVHERLGILRWHPIVLGTPDEGTIYDGSRNLILPTYRNAA
jgi:hypothetical protein